MSKAFVRESEFDVPPDISVPASLLPDGAKNCLTAAGAARLQEELARLVDVERPALAAAGDDSVPREKLQAVDQRIRSLRHSLSTAEIVPPPADDRSVVRFGATVTVEDEEGEVATYRLVGVDETDPAEGAVSWTSPIARALMNARVGEHVTFRTPVGGRELEVLHVEY